MSKAARRAKRRGRDGRDRAPIARPVTDHGLPVRPRRGINDGFSSFLPRLQDLRSVSDLRRFSFDAFNPPRLSTGSRAHYVVSSSPVPARSRRVGSAIAALTSRIGFKVPDRVLICVRRRRRREVIHALGVAGGRVRRPRLNRFSSISCKG